MDQQAKGSFDVKRTAMDTVDAGGGSAFARIRFEKRFHGDLDATSVVEMLSVGDPASGSAGYVALEHVTGSLRGRTGRFMLQHNGVMDRGQASLALTIVPDSGTDALAGLRGSMQIEVAGDGAHSYTFDFAFK